MKNAKNRKATKLISLLLMIVLMISVLPAVTAETAEEVPPDVTLIVGDTIEMGLEEGTENILWESENPEIATITNEGVVEAISVGDTVITATFEGTVFHGYVHVIPKEAISMNRTHTIVNAGETYQLKLEGAKGKISWYVTHPDIVSVNASGKVTAKAAGLALVVAELNGVKYTCLFNVRPAVKTSADAVDVVVGNAEVINALAAAKGTKITCSIDNKGIADVKVKKIDNNTAEITVTGKKPGKAVVTVSNSKTKEKVKIAVTVSQAVTGSAKQPESNTQDNTNYNPPANEQTETGKTEDSGKPATETNPDKPTKPEEQKPAPEKATEDKPTETKPETESQKPAVSEETTKQEEQKQNKEEKPTETKPQNTEETKAETKPAGETASASQNTGTEKPDSGNGKQEDTKPAAEQYTITYSEETVDIPYETETRYLPTEYKGNEYVARNGQKGQKTVKYEIKTDSNGKQVSKTAVSETITKNPVTEIYVIGTFEPTVTVEVVNADPTGMTGERNSDIDKRCEEQALWMAENGVQHSSDVGMSADAPNGGYLESVGGWGSLEDAIAGTEAHGGDAVNHRDQYGFGVVKKTETLPDGSTKETYYAVSQGEDVAP